MQTHPRLRDELSFDLCAADPLLIGTVPCSSLSAQLNDVCTAASTSHLEQLLWHGPTSAQMLQQQVPVAIGGLHKLDAHQPLTRTHQPVLQLTGSDAILCGLDTQASCKNERCSCSESV